MLQDSGPPLQFNASETERLVAERYQLERRLGRGAMGAVYRVIDERTGRALAMKRMLREGLPANSVSLFEQEFHVLSELAHPCIVSVFDYGVDEQGPFYTMELLDGGDLGECGRMPWREACAVLRDVASALGLLHSRRLLHGDLSTRNVRLTADGRAKLIDFGTMTPMGVAKMVAGTPPFIPPETLQGQALDGRTDLYSLGAVAYRMLTGTHAFPARSLRELPEVWRRAPRSPVYHAPEIPEALGDLVLELLRMDRMARPPSTAAVIERLCAIADLPRDERDDMREAYLAMPALVGRGAAVGEVRALLAGARGGVAVAIEGERGVGRTRFLDACVLDATLLGATVLRVGANDGVPRDYGVARAIASKLVRELPELAQRAARPWRGLLAHVIDEFAEGKSSSGIEPERRHLQAALREWVLGVARQRILVLAIDDFDAADEPSAAFLGALAHHGERRALSLLVTTSPKPAGAAMRLLQSMGRRVVLAPLGQDETETLLRSVFGEAENIAIVARRVHELSGGSPRAIMEIAQHLVDRGLARHEAGGWVLPRKLGADGLTSGVSLARLGEASDAGRELVRVLSLTDPLSIPFSDYPELLGRDPGAAHRAVMEMLSSGFLVPVGDRYRLSHLADLVAAGIEPAVTKELHARLARVKERQDDALGLAHHLFESGEPRRALDVVRANRKSKAFSRPEATALLERVILESEALALPRSERIVLTVALVGTAALFGDRERFQRYAPGLLRELKRDSGFDDWDELASSGVPVDERLPRAMERVQARFDATPEAERGLPGQHAFTLLAKVSSHFSSMASCSMDARLLADLPSFLPFAVLSPAISVLDESLSAVREFLTCHGLRARALALSVVERLRQPDRAGLPEAGAASLRFGMLYMLGAMDGFDGLPDAASHVVEFEDVPRHRSNSWRVRRVAHLLQGDFQAANDCHRRAEVLELLDGQEQAFPGTVIRIEASAHWMVGNIAGVKEAIERIAELAAVFPGWQSTLEVARSHYRRLSGDAEGALEEILPAVARSAPGADPDWLWAVAAHVAALTAVGRHDEAARLGLEYSETARQEELIPANRCLVRPVAEALVRAGRLEEALRLCNAGIDELEAAQVRGLWLGLFYEARALAHAALGDTVAFERDAARCDAEYRRGKDSTLIANYQRLLREAARYTGSAFSEPAPRAQLGLGDAATRREGVYSESFLTRLSVCCTREERVRYLLAVLMEHAGADAGYLYVVRTGQLEHAASIPEDHRSPQVVESLLESCLQEQVRCETQTAGFLPQTDEPEAESLCPVSLVVTRGGETVIVAMAALRCAEGMSVLHPELVSTIAASLLDHEDAEPLVCAS